MEIKLSTRTFDEMVVYFIDQVAQMRIEDRYKVQLVGMITAIQTKHEEECK